MKYIYSHGNSDKVSCVHAITQENVYYDTVLDFIKFTYYDGGYTLISNSQLYLF